MGMIRPFLLASVLGLAGCNMVITTTPIVQPADASGPQPRPGLWIVENHCSLRERNPANSWPACARGFIVRPGDVVGFSTDKADSGWKAIPYVIVGDAGRETPQVAQIDIHNPAPKQDEPADVYVFVGLRPLAFDAAGRVTRFRSWQLDCGPLPDEAAQKAGAKSYVTAKPYPGLLMDDGGNNCTPRDAAGLVSAAAATEALGPPETAKDPGAAHWVRDTYP